MKTMSGSVTADLDNPPFDSQIRLETVSGEITIRVREDSDLKVSMNAVHGRVTSDFPDCRSRDSGVRRCPARSARAPVGSPPRRSVATSRCCAGRSMSTSGEISELSEIMTAVFSHGRLRLYLLKLLAEGPKHGYELIRLLENRFLGLYAPSAGTIYPRLARMETEGLVTHTAAGGRKIYQITDAGRAELTSRAGELAALESEIHASVADLSSLANDIEREVRGSVLDIKRELREATRDAGAVHRPPPWSSRRSSPAAESGSSESPREPAVTDLERAVAELAARRAPDGSQRRRERARPAGGVGGGRERADGTAPAPAATMSQPPYGGEAAAWDLSGNCQVDIRHDPGTEGQDVGHGGS